MTEVRWVEEKEMKGSVMGCSDYCRRKCDDPEKPLQCGWWPDLIFELI